MTWDLVVRQALTTMADQVFCSYEQTRLENHTGCHQFTPLRIRYSEDRDLAYRRMVRNDGLDLGGIDIFAACDDHVLQSVQYIEITVRVLVTDVSGAKETVSERSRCILLIVPISSHYVCPTRDQFSALPSLYLSARFVRDLHVDTGTWSSARHESFVRLLLVPQTGEISRLGESIDLDQLSFRQKFSSSPDKLRRHRRTTIGQHLKTAQIILLRLRRLCQQVDHRRN